MSEEITWYYWVDVARSWRAGRSNSKQFAITQALRFSSGRAGGVSARAMRVISCRELDGLESGSPELIAEFAAGGEQTAGAPLTEADRRVF